MLRLIKKKKKGETIDELSLIIFISSFNNLEAHLHK